MHTVNLNNTKSSNLISATSVRNTALNQLSDIDPASANNNTQEIFYHNPSYMRIVQDPYPPINCSPDIFDPTTSCYSNQISMADFINIDEGGNTAEIKQESGMFHEGNLRFLKWAVVAFLDDLLRPCFQAIVVVTK